MRDRDKTLGIALVVLGGLFLLWQVAGRGAFPWPLLVILPGLALLGSAFMGRREMAGLAIPGSIVTTIGLILLFLEATDHMEAWAYAWALIVAGAGFGRFVQGALTSDPAQEREGLRTVYTGLVLFAVFGFVFEFIFWGGLGGVMRWLLPLLLIGAGVYLLFFRDQQTPIPWFTPRGGETPTPGPYEAPPSGPAPTSYPASAPQGAPVSPEGSRSTPEPSAPAPSGSTTPPAAPPAEDDMEGRG